MNENYNGTTNGVAGTNTMNAMYVVTNGSMTGDLGITTTSGYFGTGWTYWRDYYYPQVIRESYPVYIQERAKDNAKQAYEIVKILKDKKLVKLEKVSDFVDLMDELIKIL